MDDIDGQLPLDELLSINDKHDREQPLISNNIYEQLKHMELDAWSISVNRRLRDAISRIQPRTVLEIGGQIGLRTSWLFDLIERDDWNPENYVILEEGPKFGVILKRLIQRYNVMNQTHVAIQHPMTYIEEYTLWKQTQLVKQGDNSSHYLSHIDCIIVDSNIEHHIDLVDKCLKVMDEGGYLFTLEPTVPTDDLDTKLPEVQQRISNFNHWIRMIRESKDEFEIGFTPLHEGTIVTFRKMHQSNS
ncbi:MAG: hypothetical protein VW230_00175 [Candidatus Poseidoniales archaeon]